MNKVDSINFIEWKVHMYSFQSYFLFNALNKIAWPHFPCSKLCIIKLKQQQKMLSISIRVSNEAVMKPHNDTVSMVIEWCKKKMNSEQYWEQRSSSVIDCVTSTSQMKANSLTNYSSNRIHDSCVLFLLFLSVAHADFRVCVCVGKWEIMVSLGSLNFSHPTDRSIRSVGVLVLRR